MNSSLLFPIDRSEHFPPRRLPLMFCAEEEEKLSHKLWLMLCEYFGSSRAMEKERLCVCVQYGVKLTRP